MLLVVNAGSSSVKVSLFDGTEEIRRGGAGEIGAQGHQAALARLLADGFGTGVKAAAHRVVHGGADLVMPCRLEATSLARIEACVPLAPLHNPANLVGIRAMASLLPDLPQYASFDTGFHASNPEVALAYALPAAERARGIRRYGFHGISYAGLVRHLRAMLPKGLPKRLLGLHLGNGASLCAMVEGVSVATTMGYSPLDGLTMGTRSGSIDGTAVLRLAELHGIAAAGRILNTESGLLGLGGSNDMRVLQAAGTPEARFARAHFAYWVQRHAGSMMAAMGGLDAIAFTGGIGENDTQMREQIVQALSWAGRVPVYVVPAEEERTIALDAQALMARGL